MPTSNPLLDPDARLVIGHRGNRVGAAENTMNSLRQAVDMGADALEFDVRMTRDGIPVVVHDADVDRTTDGRGPVRLLTFEELRKLDAGVRSPVSDGRRHVVPSLEEVLDAFRETPLVIEVKEIGAADETERLVRRFGAVGRVVIGSSDAQVMRRSYRSGLASCASMLDASLLIPLALLGLTPPKPMYDVLSVTPRFHGVPIPVRRMAIVARRAGIATQVWTVNDPTEALALWDAGVAGIVTDDPGALLRARRR